MKSRDILNYPDALIECSKTMLNNCSILNVITTIVFNKTKLHDYKTVIKVLSIINEWF